MSEPGSPEGNGNKKKKGTALVVKDLKDLNQLVPGSAGLAKPDEPPASLAETDKKADKEKIKALTFDGSKGIRRKIYSEVHPDRNPDNLALAQDLMRIINQINADAEKQLAHWKGNIRPGDGKRYPFIRQIWETAIDADGDEYKKRVGTEVSPEALPLPQTPEQYLRAYDAYLSGASWDDVKHQLNYMPDEIRIEQSQQKRQRTGGENFGEFYRGGKGDEGLSDQFYTEFAQVQKLEDLPAEMSRLHAAYPRARAQIIGMASYRASVICNDALEEARTLDDVSKFKVEAQQFFATPGGQGLLLLRAIDTIDARAIALIRESMKGKKAADLLKVADDIRKYDFRMKIYAQAPLLESLDERAKKTLIASLQNRRTIESLDALEAEARAFTLPSDPQASEEFKAQLLDWIQRKKAIIAYRKQIGWDEEKA